MRGVSGVLGVVDDSGGAYRVMFYLFAILLLGLLIYLLSPILTPFLIAALLAYMGDPVVDRLEQKIPRGVAVTAVFCIIFLVILLIAVILIPLLEEQVTKLLEKAPQYIVWLESIIVPWMDTHFGISDPIDEGLARLKQSLLSDWRQTGSIVTGIISSISHSGVMFFAWLGNMVLIPVVTFYLLRDWDFIVQRVHELIPRSLEERVVSLTRQSDEVLGAFLRGQLLVMICLGFIYSFGLWLVGLDLGILIGLLAGAVSFVPYLGFIVGILIAGLAALIQFQEIWSILMVALVFGAGQVIESFWLTPLLVGDRIGLHPVAVIFAVMAGGQLFGFFGILLALPVAAVAMVMLRFAHERYRASQIYSHTGE